MGLLETLRALLGKTLDDPATAELLASFPDRRIGKPDGGDQYVVVRSAGFDLLFRSPAPRQARLLNCVFLYADGQERHRAFADLPYMIAFTDGHESLVTKLGPPTRDSIGVLGTLRWAEWEREGYQWYCAYGGEAAEIRHLIVSRQS